MHLIDHGRSHIEKTYKRPFRDRLIRSFLSITLSKSIYFRIVGNLSKFIKPLSFFFPNKVKEKINLMQGTFPSNQLPKKEIYPAINKKKAVARVALLTGCVQKVISPQINEATIRLLNRHNIEVVVLKNVECCGKGQIHRGNGYGIPGRENGSLETAKCCKTV